MTLFVYTGVTNSIHIYRHINIYSQSISNSISMKSKERIPKQDSKILIFLFICQLHKLFKSELKISF